MKSYLKHHLVQYLIILLLFATTVTTLISPIELAYKIPILVICVITYFFWAIWHHWEDHRLNLTTVLEYLVLALFILWVLISLAV